MSKDDDRTAVTTYVPSYQKDEWATHAEQLEMSQAEFVRTMVQAGRRGFDDTDPDSTDSEGSNPRGDMEETVLQALDDTGPLTWEDLHEEVTNDLEDQLEEAIVSLQDEDLISHRPRDNSYVLETDR
jgi:hypothetical protein